MSVETMPPIELSLFASRIEAVCEEMGAVLQRTAFSPNIKDRLDFSCAVFDASGNLCAQAAHIPVHMGSMAYAMRDVVSQIKWQAGDMVIVNDPFLGGTHLPDVTLIAPLFIERSLVAFVANRAHHADIGSETPGSMPISTTLDEEGIVIPPTILLRDNKVIDDVMNSLLSQTSAPQQSHGDFAAQISANRTGLLRLSRLVDELEHTNFKMAVNALNDYAERLAMHTLSRIPAGVYEFTDVMDSDGMGHTNIPIRVTITVSDHSVDVDFSGTAKQVRGNINCPLSVAAAAVYYVFSCLMPSYTPTCQGRFRNIKILAPEASLVNAVRPAAVAAGNVETSTRIVDVVMGALSQAIPKEISAASHGSMNNIAMGAHYDKASDEQSWDYYETIGGGMGAGPKYPGIDAIQTHMTNTRNTPVEVLESLYPVRVNRYSIRGDSGGRGYHCGGNGIVREFEFLQAATVTVLTERRNNSPWGLSGGGDALPGLNQLNDESIKDKQSIKVDAGDRLTIATAGGGGWGTEQN
ncbi:hydantoinase B/oxoprolinase family protein [Kaarinaea lacus]